MSVGRTKYIERERHPVFVAVNDVRDHLNIGL
jgi:hypothetical protein